MDTDSTPAASESETVQPEVVDAASGPAGDGATGGATGANVDELEQVTRPTKLIRIASMVRTMLDEVRRAPLDDAGRRALREIHEKSIHELEEVLSPDLRRELEDVSLPFSEETPSESELRIAQAQLVGWLEGLFHGIQATLFTQQQMTQGQLEQMRQQRSLEMGGGGPGPQGTAPSGSGYL